MSETSDKLDLLKTTLETAQPGRIVTRGFEDIGELQDTELRKGIYTIVNQGEGGFNNLPGREAMYGKLDVVIVARLMVDDKEDGQALENAELTMVDEIKALCRALVPGIDSLMLNRWRQSGQIERPYGWVIFEMEMMA